MASTLPAREPADNRYGLGTVGERDIRTKWAPGTRGHTTITLTSDTYGHVLEARQRQVARAMDAVLDG